MSVKEALLSLPPGKMRWAIAGLLSLLTLGGSFVRTAVSEWKEKVDAVVEDYPRLRSELQDIKEMARRTDQRTYDLALKAGVKTEPPVQEKTQ